MSKWQWFMSKGQMWIGVVALITIPLFLFMDFKSFAIRSIGIVFVSLYLIRSGRRNMAKYRSSVCKVGG